ncbi:GNAT family N-acetyltransferase [Phytohalomonas tamaricis]|uniref:GNAT family N-acetyltransferase n=1 Tax=Phytohalomonas tamaricis TaxID=2081032 RepID=UPI000D0B7852|nr:GNAT family N-acetyltransferase [Phytohalomonas tamaricis]
MSVAIESGDWATLGEDCTAIRYSVFIEEQQVPVEEELDARDGDCLHFLLRVDGEPVGTARLLPDGHIGRVAILAAYRGKGLGRELMQTIIEKARDRGHDSVALAAQTHALDFYARLGFIAHGPEFLDAGIPHRDMTLNFKG